jgi:hypothetical protein
VEYLGDLFYYEDWFYVGSWVPKLGQKPYVSLLFGIFAIYLEVLIEILKVSFFY